MPMKRALAMLLLLPAALRAELGGSFNAYSGSSGVRVITPAVHGEAELDPRTRLAIQVEADAVSAASFDYAKGKTHRGTRATGTCWTCHPPGDALSGASRSYMELRRGAQVSVKRLQGPLDLRASYLSNRENDFASDGGSVGVAWTSEDANTVAELGLQALFDRIGSVTRSWDDSARTLGAELSLTRVLSPRGQAQAVASWAQAEGYLGNPYSFVSTLDQPDVPLRAAHPRDKQRLTLRGGLKQGLWRGAAAEAALRWYQDSWDVLSLTAELSLAQRLGTWVLEPQARWQDQMQGAYFYRSRYASAQPLLTRDLKLAPHQSLGYGLGLRGPLGGGFELEGRWTRYQRQDRVDYSLLYADGPETADLYQLAVTLR